MTRVGGAGAGGGCAASTGQNGNIGDWHNGGSGAVIIRYIKPNGFVRALIQTPSVVPHMIGYGGNSHNPETKVRLSLNKVFSNLGEEVRDHCDDL